MKYDVSLVQPLSCLSSELSGTDPLATLQPHVPSDPPPPGADPEDVITGAFKVLDPEGKGTIKKQL